MRSRQYVHEYQSKWRSQGINLVTNQTQWDSSGQTATESFVRSSISDDLGWGENTCHHMKFDTSPLSVQLPFTAHAWLPYKAAWSQEGFFPITGPLGLEVPSLDFQSAIDALLRDASGAMPMSASLVVNVIEAASIKEIVPQILKGTRGLLKHKVGRKSLKELANGNLLYQFGVKPLISDLKAFLNVRGKVEKRIKELESRNGRTVKLRHRLPPVTFSHPMTSGSPSEKGAYITGTWSGTVSGTLSCDVTSFFVNDNASQIKLWSSALGLSSPLTNAWEIVPFSFVADWILPIGETFQRIEDKLGFHETVRYLNTGRWMQSVKVEATLNSKGVTVDPEYPGWSSYPYTIPQCKYSNYARTPGIPVCPLISPPSGWGLNRTGLTLSLIAQKAIK